MSRKRRSLLGRDSNPKELARPNLLSERVDAVPEPTSEEDPFSDTDLGFSAFLPEAVDEPIPGFFEYDGGDGLEEPPTEEVPTPMMNDWTDDFPAPVVVPDAPPMSGVLDGATPAPVQRQRRHPQHPPLPSALSDDVTAPPGSEPYQYDGFEELFDVPAPPSVPKTVGNLQVKRLLLFLFAAVVMGVIMGIVFGLILFKDKLLNMNGDLKSETPMQDDFRVMKGLNAPKRSADAAADENAATGKKGGLVSKPGKPIPVANSNVADLKIIHGEGEPPFEVFVDGEYWGQSPVHEALPPGVHTIQAIPTGREHLKKIEEITLSAGDVREISFEF